MKKGKKQSESPVQFIEAVPSGDEKRMMDMIRIHADPLPYLLERQVDRDGLFFEVYRIPEEDKEKLLEEYYPFTPCPKLDDVLYDIHEDKTFTVKDYLIIRENGRNYLVSPYYPHSHGTVLDWVIPNQDTNVFMNKLKI